MTNEVRGKHLFWIKDAQQTEDKQRLGLEVNDEGIFDCPGQIRDISRLSPSHASLFLKTGKNAHQCTLHGGVGLTIACIRERYWVPSLRRLTKWVTTGCCGCRGFQVKAPENLPRE